MVNVFCVSILLLTVICRVVAGLVEQQEDSVVIPAGPFIMGCNPANDSDCEEDEGPLRKLTVPTFTIDRTEVTQNAYQSCIAAGKCTVPDKDFDPQRNGNYPVTDVSWFQAKQYCAWRKKRLPTEVEWEKAARGTDGRKYPWGNDPPDCIKANFSSKCGNATQPVGSHPEGASPYGVLDMTGNVEEWTEDWYSRGYYSKVEALTLLGPATGMERVVRGGAFNYDWWHSRATLRFYQPPETGTYSLGFRCAADVPKDPGSVRIDK